MANSRKTIQDQINALERKKDNAFTQYSKFTSERLGIDLPNYNSDNTGAGTLPPGLPAGSVAIGKSGGKTVYRTPDGRQLVEK
jgi:hypothetical protein